MPIYEFQCRQCGSIFEELVRMGSTGEGLACPQCGATEISKKVSACYGHVASPASSCQFADACPSTRSEGSAGCPGGGCGCHA